MNPVLDNALWSGNAHPALAARIAAYLDYPLWAVPVESFADSETRIQIPHPLKSAKLTIVQSLAAPVNQHLMELLLMVDAAHRAGCVSITVLMPYCAYARQDKSDPLFHSPLAAQIVAQLLATRPIDRLISLDLHSKAFETFYTLPFESLSSTALFAADLKHLRQPLIVSPDRGGSLRAQALARALATDWLVLDKQQEEPTLYAYSLEKKPWLQDRHCIVVDDIIDTGKTLRASARFLRKHRASRVHAYVTHAVGSDSAQQNLDYADLDAITVTDSLPERLDLKNKPFYILSMAPLLAQALL